MRTFIVATDFSPGSDRALRRAVLAARKAGARLCLIHAMADASGEAIAAERDADEASTLLQETAETIGSHDGVACEYRLLTGSPVPALVEAARTMPAELVVIGPHQSNRLRDMFLGTTTERILKEAPCPVLIANGVPSAACSNILLATDFSACSIAAARAAHEAGMLQDARITVLHAYETHDPGSVQRALVNNLHDPQSIEREEATRAMRDYVGASGIAPSKTVVIPLATAPAETIRRIAEREQADLIVIGTQGRSGLERFVLGSVARDIAADSSIDVMVAPLPPG